MFLRCSFLLFICFGLIGCSGSGGTSLESTVIEIAPLNITCDEESNIQGCWAPEDCEVIDPEATELSYGRNVYSFREAGIMQLEVRVFDSADCSSGLMSSNLYDLDTSFTTGSSVLSNDGTNAEEIYVSYDDEFGHTVTYRFIYALFNGNRLCTTDNLQLLPTQYILNPGADSLTLNYETCLQRIN